MCEGGVGMWLVGAVRGSRGRGWERRTGSPGDSVSTLSCCTVYRLTCVLYCSLSKKIVAKGSDLPSPFGAKSLLLHTDTSAINNVKCTHIE